MKQRARAYVVVGYATHVKLLELKDKMRARSIDEVINNLIKTYIECVDRVKPSDASGHGQQS